MLPTKPITGEFLRALPWARLPSLRLLDLRESPIAAGSEYLRDVPVAVSVLTKPGTPGAQWQLSNGGILYDMPYLGQ